jgi:hypothetical protein
MSIHVTGIGGLFFRATDPAALAAWYHEHLGISPYTEGLWQQEGGPTVFMPFAHDTDHFPPAVNICSTCASRTWNRPSRTARPPASP